MQTSLRAFLPVQKGRAAASKPSLKRSRDFVENQLHPQNEENDSPRRIASPRKRPRGQKDSPADALARKAHDLLRETGKHPAFFTVDGEDVEDSAGTAPLAGSESTVVEDPSPPLLVGPGSPPAADLQEATRDAILESTTEEQEPINELPNGGTHSISVLSRPLDDTSTSDTVGEDEWNEPPPPSPTRSVVLPMASGHALPAYLRLQSRTTLQKPRAQALPPSYDLLLRFFAELDQVVRHWRSRSQPCLLSKCKKHIESTVRRTFEIWHLQQIAHVFPEAYIFTALNPNGNWERDLSLVVAFRDDSLDAVQTEPLQNVVAFLEQRLGTFHQRLRAFARSTQAGALPGDDARDAAQGSGVDDGAPEIPRATIPLANHFKASSSERSHARKDLAPDPSDAQAALLPISTPEVPEKPRATTLLERIRLKEQEKKAKILASRGPEQSNLGAAERAMNSRMPEVAKALSTLFHMQKRTAMTMAAISEHLTRSLKTPLSTVEASNHVMHLAAMCPEFCTIVDGASGKLVKLQPGTKLSQVMDALACKSGIT